MLARYAGVHYYVTSDNFTSTYKDCYVHARALYALTGEHQTIRLDMTGAVVYCTSDDAS